MSNETIYEDLLTAAVTIAAGRALSEVPLDEDDPVSYPVNDVIADAVVGADSDVIDAIMADLQEAHAAGGPQAVGMFMAAKSMGINIHDPAEARRVASIWVTLGGFTAGLTRTAARDDLTETLSALILGPDLDMLSTLSADWAS